MKNKLLRMETDALAELKADLSKKHHLHWMKLIGSKARGDYDAESDIDIVIVLEEVDWQIERDVFEMCFYAGLKHDVVISPVVYSRKEIEESRTRITPFYQAIETEGISL